MITFSTDHSTRIRTAHYTGIVDDETLLRAYAALLSEPGYDATFNDLVDLRGVSRLEVSADAMRQLISMYTPVDQLGVQTRLAVVAASDVTFGMSRMYELLRGDGVPEEIRVFRSHDDAVAWLTA
ncbi:MAG TPA: hypothetical protein VEB19_04345 [Gemmatimonadaceae bacterium]|nr:hypothetical protein [Gemmatimonadaceae bacterium]